MSAILEEIGKLLSDWGDGRTDLQRMKTPTGQQVNPYATVPIPRKINIKRGEMKIEIERIVNGWLVAATTSPSSTDPLAQRGVNGRHFADTPEAICGMIAEWVLEECKRQEG